LWILRFQVGVVYVFGGIAKLGSDWLIHGEPLRIWLAANAEMPVLGRLFSERWFAIGMSWAGMLFDLSIVPLLSWRRTRPYAYVVACLFHAMTALLFEIGMFPWIMTALATIFFHPSCPRRFIRRVAPSSVTPSGPQI